MHSLIVVVPLPLIALGHAIEPVDFLLLKARPVRTNKSSNTTFGKAVRVTLSHSDLIHMVPRASFPSSLHSYFRNSLTEAASRDLSFSDNKAVRLSLDGRGTRALRRQSTFAKRLRAGTSLRGGVHAKSQTTAEYDSSSADLQKQLSIETLARRYYEFPYPGTVVQVSYLRAPSKEVQQMTGVATDATKKWAEWGRKLDKSMQTRGARDRAARIDDFIHFERLLSHLNADDTYTAPDDSFSDCQVNVDIPLISFGGARPTMREEVRLRYQRFTEFSSYTFVLDGPQNDYVGQGAAAVSILMERGERLVNGLKSLGSWWNDLPGQLFLVAVVALAPKTLPDECYVGRDLTLGGDSLGLELQACDAWDEPGLLKVLSYPNASGFPGSHPVGAVVGRYSRAAIFASYDLQPVTRHFHAAVLFSDDGDQSELDRLSRNTARFLEMEQYRLLALLCTATAKGLFIELGRINSEIMEVLNVLRDEEMQRMSPDERRVKLVQVASLQTRCEALEVEVRDRLGASYAYGTVVNRKIDRIKCKPVGGAMPLDVFVQTRLEPALLAFERAGIRLTETTAGVDRCKTLLRTIIDSENQATNDKLLNLGTVVSIFSFTLGVLQFIRAVYWAP